MNTIFNFVIKNVKIMTLVISENIKNTVTVMNKVLHSLQLMKSQMKLVLHSLNSQTEPLR